ncbi:hypothetical protein [Pasteuria penetrans]|uniref:hypothetical protein n=1 Tax=Pasteuria penetrans TaxID=86005 RepID=UPI0011EE1870|nr:hypothetical protein [Pasteuria penetrans]
MMEIFERAQNWLNIEQIPLQNDPPSDNLRSHFMKLRNILDEQGIRISEDGSEAQVIRFSLRSSAPKSVKKAMEEKIKQPFFTVEVRPVYRDGRKIGYAREFSSDIFGFLTAVDTYVDGKYRIIVLKENGEIEWIDPNENRGMGVVDGNRIY